MSGMSCRQEHSRIHDYDGMALKLPYSDEKENIRSANVRATRIFPSRNTVLLRTWFAVTIIFAFAIIVKFEGHVTMKDTTLDLIVPPTSNVGQVVSKPLLLNSLSKNSSEVISDVNPVANQISRGGENYNNTVAAKAMGKGGKIVYDQSSNHSKEKPLEIHMKIDDPPTFYAPIINASVKDFDPSINGVVVTKIQGSPHLQALRQMLCLFTKAYNYRVNHDIIIFTSEMIDQEEIEGLEQIVYPAKLMVEIDNPGLHQMVDDLSPSQRNYLLERCNKNSTSELSWYTECSEESSYGRRKGERIAYCWQAEFRALWIWTHPILVPYKYMMWMDSDAFCTRIWKQDPFATMERHDLALLFDHFPQGAARGYEFSRRTKEAFDRAICKVSLVNGTLVAADGRCINRPKSKIAQVHGFFHVSSLDFYRSDAVMKWNRALIGDSKFSRIFDDQIGITIPAAVLAGNRSRDMRSMGVYLRVFHNYVLDGRPQDWRGYFVNWWKRNANTTFPEANGQCFVDISG